MTKKNNLEFKTIEVNKNIKNPRKVFDNLEFGDRIHWETHDGEDKYDGMIFEKSPNHFYAVTREYVEEQPEGYYLMGAPGKVKFRWGNCLREKCFELKDDMIRYWGETRNAYFENNLEENNKKYYLALDRLMKSKGL